MATSRSLGVVTFNDPALPAGRLSLRASISFLLMFQFFGFQFFENGVEALEIALPKALVFLQPHIELAKRRGPQLINPALSIHANIHQSGIAEHAEMTKFPTGCGPVRKSSTISKRLGSASALSVAIIAVANMPQLE